ncbi:NAD(P)/FAD-dependent oxidoreductase [Geodermatophilus ruber]|uniref:3-phenylpropionate/trans-cinnamate dioxygenase ferredoxin reductase subunit n=1 Tax=Geodermatophilus ruber TaxID=504800 RepID=A0A1I4GKF2_9ACTN|nr:FAD-dependent oxidoreductase [Geodermatophilus ruber]SFL29963.1 3-phenylpropionate/trans-cinnamate dioxygenase ferredoxin reductase subunit [Geodermatophilus ruber]
MQPSFVIVGANLAGGRAAQALRREGFSGRVVLVGAEPHPPYERPPLSKDLLLGKQAPEALRIADRQSWSDQEIDLRLGTTVTRLLPGEQSVETDSGELIRADKVLLCTGGRARRLAVEGHHLGGVHALRSLDDALTIREQLVPGAHVTVVGAGFIGAEVAASAQALGCRVTLLEVAGLPLQRVLGPALGQVLATAYRDQGVDLRLGTGVHSLVGDDRVRRVVTTDGSVIETDLVVVGIGIEPAVELAASAGARVDNGILVDEFCATSIDGIYAAGDVANHPNPILGERVRLENWQNAQNQGLAAAGSMLGHRRPFAEVPWFWSDQYAWNLQMAGQAGPEDDVVWRGDVDGLAFSAFFLRAGVLRAAFAVNRPRDVHGARRLIERGGVVDVDALRDPGADLRKLAA